MIYTTDEHIFSELEAALKNYRCSEETVRNALAWLNTDNERDTELIRSIKKQDGIAADAYAAHNVFFKAAKHEVLKKGSDELVDRFVILEYALAGVDVIGIDRAMDDHCEKKVKSRREAALRSVYGDDTNAILYAIDLYMDRRHFYRTSPQKKANIPTMLRAAEIVSASYPWFAAEICSLVLDRIPAPEKKKGISGLLGKKEIAPDAERAMGIMKNLMSGGLSPEHHSMFTALIEASAFSDDMKKLVREKRCSIVKVMEQIAGLGLDPKRCLGVVMETDPAVDSRYVNCVCRSISAGGYGKVCGLHAEQLAEHYTDAFIQAMKEQDDMEVQYKMDQVLKKVKPDIESPVGSVNSNAKEKVAKAVSDHFKDKDAVYSYVMGNTTFAEVFAAIDNDTITGYSFSDRNNYFRLYGLDDFLIRCLEVMTLCTSGYNNFIWHDTGFEVRENTAEFVGAMKAGDMNGRQLLRSIGNAAETMWDKESKLDEIAVLLSDRTDEIAETDCTGLPVLSRVLQLKILGAQANRYKAAILSAAGDSSKAVREAVAGIISVHKSWQEDVIEMLSSKKAAVRELALTVIEAQGKESYTRALESALNSEKSAKIKTRIGAMLGVEVEGGEKSSAASSGDIIADMTKGSKAKKVAWLFTQPFSPVRLADGSAASEQHLQALLLCYANDPGNKDKNTDAIAAMLDPADTEQFALEVFSRWLEEGAAAKTKWVLYFAGVHGGSEAIDTLVHYIKEWSENSRGAIACEAVYAIALNGSSQALMTVDDMSRKYKKRQVRGAAGLAMEKAAEQLGITKEELADRIVPDLGFDEKMCRTFDYGARQFSVYLTPSLDIEIFNGDKKIKNLPKPGANDDAEKAEKAYAEFKDMKKQMKAAVTAQRSRLEYVLLCDRKWTAEGWKKLFVRNPLMHCFAIGLIWGIYSESGLSATFRYLDDGSFTTSDEDEFEVPENAQIGLVHPIELTEEELSAWKEQLADYEIVQPFAQLERTVYPITDKEKTETEITRFYDRELNSLAFAGKMLKYGWYKGEAQDAGMFFDFYRSDSSKAGEGYIARLKFSGMYIETFYDDSGDITVETLSFYTHGNTEPVPAGEISPRYFSEIIVQLTAVIGEEEEK